MKETLLTTARFDVERRAYNVPGMGEVRREVVVHPGAVLIVPMLTPTEVVMIRNYRFSVDEELLELPAGTLELSEAPIDCAARELEEETGYRAGRLEPLCEFFTSPGFTNERMFGFVATNLTHAGDRLEATEQIRVETLTLENALTAAADGRIRDGKTIAALHICDRRRKGAS